MKKLFPILLLTLASFPSIAGMRVLLPLNPGYDLSLGSTLEPGPAPSEPVPNPAETDEVPWSVRGVNLAILKDKSFSYNLNQYLSPSSLQGVQWSTPDTPPWMTLSAAGVLSGTAPSAAGTTGSLNVTASRAGVNKAVSYTWSIENESIGWYLTGTNFDPQARVPYSFDLNTAVRPLGVGKTLTWSATGLPSWLTLNPTTGVLSGTASDTASYSTISINVVATDGNGETDDENFTLKLRGNWTVRGGGTKWVGLSHGDPFSFDLNDIIWDQEPYHRFTWRILNLPSWLTLTEEGLLTGDSGNAGSMDYLLDLEATDQYGIKGFGRLEIEMW